MKKETKDEQENKFVTPKGLKPISPAGDVFLDEVGRLYTLEFDTSTGRRRLLVQKVLL